MLHPTDRVLAKVMARALRDLVKKIDISDMEAALLLSNITVAIVGGNKPLQLAVIKLLEETTLDILAEQRGLASSNVGSPVAAPWNEDAGSGDISFENN